MSTFDKCKAISIPAAGDLTGLVYQFGLINTSAQVQSGGTNLTAQGQVSGIIGEEVDAQGKVTSLIVPDYGLAKVKAGAAITVGALVSTNAAGRAITHVAAVGNIAWGRAITAAGADGDIITIQFGIQTINPGT